MNKFSIKDPLGFSLIEVIVSLAIASIVSFATLSLVSDFYKDVNNTARNIEFQDIGHLIDISLASQDTCEKMFAGTKVTLPTGDSSPRILTVAELIEVENLFIRGTKFSSLNKEQNGLVPIFIGFEKVYKSFPAVGIPMNYYIVDFLFKVKKVGFFRGREEKVKTEMIYLKVDNNSKDIIGCGLTSTDEGSCILQGKTYNVSDYPFCK